jgi:hypothetical protein
MAEQTKQPNMSKDEQIGFHKGSLATLAKEREEMVKIVQVVEQLMQMHIKALKDLGIDLEAQAKQFASKQPQQQQASSRPQPKGTSRPIDDLI